MSEAEDIKNRMEQLTQFIIEVNEKIKGGDMVDLTGLDDEVASLCDRSVALPPQLAIQMQPLMSEMIAKLEDLSVTLEDFQKQYDQSQGQ